MKEITLVEQRRSTGPALVYRVQGVVNALCFRPKDILTYKIVVGLLESGDWKVTIVGDLK